MELDVRGVYPWQIRKYLAELGGVEQPDGTFVAGGWTASLTELEYRAMGSVYPRAIIRITGDPGVLEQLKLRCMRVGG